MNRKSILEQIKKQNNIIIAGHMNPDGDAIGACFAFAYALQNMGKNPKILLEKPSSTYDFLPKPIEIIHEWDEDKIVDLFIALDCADEQRLHYFKDVFYSANQTINIDHHRSNTQFADYNVVNEKVSSTCELIYDLFQEWKIPITSSMALCIYTGIVYDTGGFQHTSTTSRTHEIVSELLKHSINSSFVFHQLFYRRSYEKTKLLGMVLSRVSLYYNNKVSLSFATKEEMTDIGVKDADGIIPFLSDMEGISVAIFLYERNFNEIKVSLRSKYEVDVADIASRFSGGGHVKAAGCTIFGTVEEAKNLLLKALKDYF